jgi:peptidyl-prolyl cis-trans isomerase C
MQKPDFNTLLSVGLALLLSLSAGCKPKAAETPGAAGTPGTPGAPGTAAGTAASAGQPAPPPVPSHPTASPNATPALPGEAPGTPATAADNAPISPDKIPAVVAKVNGQAIKKNDLLEGGQVVRMRFAQMGQQLSPSAKFYHQVLNELIAITLLQQDAKAQGVIPSPQEVQQAVAARKGAFPNEAAYKQALQKAGISEESLRQQASDQLAVQKYVQTRIAPGVNVSDQTAREYYDKNKEKMQVPERLHVRHILIQVKPDAPAADKAKARQKAEEALKKVQAGGDFAKLAGEYSDDPGSKSRGGELGWVSKGQAVPQFEAAAFALQKPNDVSGIVEAPYGFQIIQLLEKQAPTTVPFDQVKERIVQGLKSQEVQKLVQARAEQLRAKGKVETYL